MLGSPGLPAIAGPSDIIDATSSITRMPSTDVGPAPMSPMDSIKEIFLEVRDGINQLVALAVDEGKDRDLAGRNAQIASGDTDAPPPPQGGSGTGGNILDSLKEALSGLGDTGMGLLGITALIAGFLVFNALADSLTTLLAPVLEFLGETLIPAIKELNEIIMSHPGGYWTLLGAVGLVTVLDEVFGISGSLTRLFTSVGTFIKTAFFLDIPDFKKLGWAGKINRALYYNKGAMANRGVIPRLSNFFSSIGRSIRSAFMIDEALAFLKTTATTWKTAITSSIFGKAARGGKGGGVLAKIGSFFRSIGSLIRGVFSAKIVTDSFAAIGRVTKAFGRVMKRVTNFVSKTLGVITRISGLGAFLKLGLAFAKAIPIVGQIIMVVQGLFGFVTGAIKGFKKEGFLGMIIGALTGLFDGLVASFVNLIFDILGWILKKFGLEKLGQFFMDIDISLGRFFDMFVGFFKSIGKIGKALFKGTLDGIKNIFSSPIKAFKATFAEVMAEPSETSEDTAPVKIDIPKGTDATAAINDLEASKREIVIPDIAKVDTSDLMGPVADPFAGFEAPVFNNVAQTGGDIYNTNASVSMPLSSSHTDETAKILSESVYN